MTDVDKCSGCGITPDERMALGISESAHYPGCEIGHPNTWEDIRVSANPDRPYRYDPEKQGMTNSSNDTGDQT